MDIRLTDLVEISNFFGVDSEYVIAGGGNTSYKNNDHLWIKGSGTSLATIAPDGFVKMDRKGLEKISSRNYSTDPLLRENEIKNELYSCIAEKTDKRPSVETSLHNLLNFPYVVHTHPTLVNGLMCSRNSTSETQAIFGRDVLLVEYTDPGYILYKLVEKRVKEYYREFGKEPQIIFLENHGVFVSANSISEIKDLYRGISEKILQRIAKNLPSAETFASDHSRLSDAMSIATNLNAKIFESQLIREFVKDKSSFKSVDTAFTPDNIVYCKAHFLFSKPESEILQKDYWQFEKNHGYTPKVIAIENTGIMCLEENLNSLNTVYEVFLDMLKISWYSENFGGPRKMTPEQIEFIDTWEVENYRRKIAKDKT